MAALPYDPEIGPNDSDDRIAHLSSHLEWLELRGPHELTDEEARIHSQLYSEADHFLTDEDYQEAA